MTLSVRVAGHLKDYTGSPVEVQLQAASDVLDVVAQLEARVPGIKDRILDEHDKTRPYVNIFVNEVSIRDMEGESTRTKDGDVVHIIPSVAGGSSGPGGEAS